MGAAEGRSLLESSRRVADIEHLVLGEYAENEMRKDFTVSERVAIADAVARTLEGRNHRPAKCGNFSTVTDERKTRDLAAEKAGLGSGKINEAAKRVVEEAEPGTSWCRAATLAFKLDCRRAPAPGNAQSCHGSWYESPSQRPNAP